MIEIGRVCVKIAGRDAGLKCVVVDDLGKGIVLIDGQTRRRKCNIKHLEPLKDKLDMPKKAGHDDVVKGFKKIKVEIKERKEKKKKTEKPVKLRKKRQKETAAETPKAAKPVKKEPKETKKKETKKPKAK